VNEDKRWDHVRPGDPAPTADPYGLACCADVSGRNKVGKTIDYVCSRDIGHPGQHVAADEEVVFAVEPPPRALHA